MNNKYILQILSSYINVYIQAYKIISFYIRFRIIQISAVENFPLLTRAASCRLQMCLEDIKINFETYL